MAEPVLVDSDVILKLCRFGCHGQLVAARGNLPMAIIGIARYALRDRVRRSKDIVDRNLVAGALEEAIETLVVLQPGEAEMALAAEMEEEAARRALDLDTGESQLLAILLNRSAPLLLTGDKRAIVAIHNLGIVGSNGRVACFEQLIATLLSIASLTALRTGVCLDQSADQAITACFACSTSEITEFNVRVGLQSYVAHLRSVAGEILFAGNDLSALPGWGNRRDFQR